MLLKINKLIIFFIAMKQTTSLMLRMLGLEAIFVQMNEVMIMKYLSLWV